MCVCVCGGGGALDGGPGAAVPFAPWLIQHYSDYKITSVLRVL